MEGTWRGQRGRRLTRMPAPDEPRGDGPAAVAATSRGGGGRAPAAAVRSCAASCSGCEGERERALQLELGGLVAEMARQGALAPALLADGAARVRSRQDQIDAITTALGGSGAGRSGPAGIAPRDRAGCPARRRASSGAVAGAWIERRHDDAAPRPPPRRSASSPRPSRPPPCRRRSPRCPPRPSRPARRALAAARLAAVAPSPAGADAALSQAHHCDDMGGVTKSAVKRASWSVHY